MSCSAVNCRKRKSEWPELLFFRFPLDAELRRKWVVAMRRENMKGEDRPWEPSKHTRLCSLHFKPEDIDHRRIYRKLNRDAVPSIFSWPDKNQKTKKPCVPEQLSPVVFVNGVPKQRKKTYQRKVIKKKVEEPHVSVDWREVVHVDLNKMPLCEKLEDTEKVIDEPHDQNIDLHEEIIEDVYLPQNQPINLEEEVIEDVFMPQNQPADLKEIIEDVFMPQNQRIYVKEEVIEYVYMPENQRIDVKEEIIEDVLMPLNQQIDLKEEIIEDLYLPQNEHLNLTEQIIENVYVSENQRIDLEEEIIEDVLMPVNQQINLEEDIIEDLYLPQNEQIDFSEQITENVYMPDNRRIDSTEEIIEEVLMPLNRQIDLKEEIVEDLYLPQNDLTEKIIQDLRMPRIERIYSRSKTELEIEAEMKEQALQLENKEIDRLKNLLNKNSEVTLRQSQKLKRLKSSKTYFQRKLSAMNKLLEELNSLE